MTDPLKIIAAAPDNEATAYPVWIIAKYLRGEIIWLAGPYFSREFATEYLENHRYRFDKKAIVYCASGHESSQYRAIYDASLRLQP